MSSRRHHTRDTRDDDPQRRRHNHHHHSSSRAGSSASTRSAAGRGTRGGAGSSRAGSSDMHRNEHNRAAASAGGRLDPAKVTMTSGASAMSSAKLAPMQRPAFGRLGRQTRLETNFFRMRIPPKLNVSQYAVHILRFKHPDDEARRRRRGRRSGAASSSAAQGKEWVDVASSEAITFNRSVFNLVCRQHLRHMGCVLAYDGRSIAYAPKEINRDYLGTRYSVKVTREGEPASERDIKENKAEEVKMYVEHAKYLHYQDVFSGEVRTNAVAEYLAALDVVIATTPLGKFVQIGRSFYSPEGSLPLGRGIPLASAWRGFYQSARLSQSGLVVNLDESFTAFWNKGGRSLIELVQDANGGEPLSTNDHRGLRDVSIKLKALKVRAIHTRITYKVHGFSNRGANAITFDSQTEKRRISISDYFHSAYGIRLRYPHLPCVKTNPKRDTYLPMEVLIVQENQRIAGTLTQDQTQGIVKVASSKPSARRSAAMRTMGRLNHSHDPVCKDFGVQVTPGLITVDARILPPPGIKYAAGQVNPSQGAWRAQREKFVHPAQLRSWVVMNTSRLRDNELYPFLDALVRSGRRAGMIIPDSKPHIFRGRSDSIAQNIRGMVEQIRNRPRQYLKENFPLQLILVIKEKQESSYNALKRVSDLELGIASQVCLAKHCGSRARGRDMYCDNVILKINVKLGGVNSIVSPFHDTPSARIPDAEFMSKPHIILGADVTHPMAGGRSPSVAALVGSRDRNAVQFTGAIRNQPPRQEVITEIGEMFKEVYWRWFENFQKRWHVDSIIMFRDGVSDGQFDEVLGVELAALRKACLEIKKDFKPMITYIIVTKRHHARFFALNREDADRSGNILPGTVIDQGITSRDYYDFYLNSHAGIQGTSKPSKYSVLIDENNIPPDVLQGYIYRLSHGFVRCNRSVSMVNSAYYAHLLAFRGRAYLGEDMSDSASSASNESVIPSAPSLHGMLGKRLFFI